MRTVFEDENIVVQIDGSVVRVIEKSDFPDSKVATVDIFPGPEGLEIYAKDCAWLPKHTGDDEIVMVLLKRH
jgi:hypothetical protein